MSEIKLLPCPFCGGKATMKISPHGAERWVLIQCSSVGCVQQQGFCRDQAEAIEQWNTRKPMQEIVERLEEEKGTYIDENGKELFQEDYFIDIDEAIKIVKEVGGMNVEITD